MDGVDRYEAESIAERVAREVGDGIRFDLGHELSELRDGLRRLERELDAERAARRDDVASARAGL